MKEFGVGKAEHCQTFICAYCSAWNMAFR